MYTCPVCGLDQSAPGRWPHCEACADLPECPECHGTIGIDEDTEMLDVYQDGVKSVCRECYEKSIPLISIGPGGIGHEDSREI